MINDENNIIEIKRVSKFFKENSKQYLCAVNDVSITITHGKAIGIVGESGSGKSTLGKICMGNLEVEQGEVLYKGQPMKKIKRKSRIGLAKHLQMVFQDPYASLDPTQKVYHILREGMRIHHLTSGKQHEHAKVVELVESVGLDADYLERYVYQLSGGQRQRVGIARALSVEPDVLVCDEPVSALDVTIQAQIMDLLLGLKEHKQMAMLFISHDLAVVKQIADEIGVMYKGHLVEYAPSDELFRQPIHAYTKALLSAVPIPDPQAMKERNLIIYKSKEINQRLHKAIVRQRIANANSDEQQLIEVTPGHFVMRGEE